MNIPRLRHLIMVLKSLSPEQLHMEHFTNVGEQRYSPCETTACALGWAAMDPTFQSQGLVLDEGYPVFRNYEGERDTGGFAASREFFDLTYNQSQYLFSDGTYRRTAIAPVKPATVIRRIRQVINGYDAADKRWSYDADRHGSRGVLTHNGG